MTPKQRRFAEEYAQHHNGRRAALAAGYAEGGATVRASELLRKPDVSALVLELDRNKAAELGVSALWIAERLKGESESEESSPASRVRALEVLAKLTGHFVERSEHVEVHEVTYRLELDRELEA